MEVNYIVIGVCAVIGMALGALWYGPLFGKKWMDIIGVNSEDMAARKEMQKNAMPLYVTQLALTLFQVYVLAHYIKGWTELDGVVNALWIWAAFVMPTVAACAMWTTETGKIKWARFLIQAGYFLVLFVIFGYILGNWG